MPLPVVTAVPGGWEGPLVSALSASGTGLTVLRRCVDLPELMAAAAAGQARAVLVSADLRRLDRTALAGLAAAGVAAVGLHPAGDAAAEGALRRLGLAHVLAADAAPDDVARAVTDAVADLDAAGGPGRAAAAVGDPAAALPRLPAPRGAGQRPDGASRGRAGGALDDAADDAEDGAPPDGWDAGDGGEGRERGRLVAVWGPAGAPGRSTVAAALAAEAALLGRSTLLVDADTHAASQAQLLGLLDESPGVAAACRAAAGGTLDDAALRRLSSRLGPRLAVLTGLPRPARWPEVSGPALSELWRVAREVADLVVADVGAPLEQDEELSFDVAAPRRNAATLTTLAAADTVVAVGAGDPVGLQRLVRGLQDLAEAVPTARPRVVVTRVRASAVGRDPHRRVADALARYAGVEDPVLVPDDPAACDAALLTGRSLTEAAPSSPARLALRALAATLVDPDTSAAAGASGSRRRRSLRR